MAVTQTDIANQALALIGASALTDLTADSGTKAEVCRLFYDANQDFCLVKRPWSSAIFRKLLVFANKTTVTGVTQADPGVVTAASHGIEDGELITFADIVGMTTLNGTIYVATSVTTDTLELYDRYGASVDTSGYTAFSSGGTVYLYGIEDMTYAYAKPSDCLQPIKVLDQTLSEQKNAKFRNEGDRIFTNQQYAGLEYIRQVTDPSDYDQELREYMALRLAWLICLRLTNNQGLWKDLDRRLTLMSVRAGSIDSRGARSRRVAPKLWRNAH